MLSLVRPAGVLLLLFTLLTGVAYPLAVTVAAQALFPREANGSLVRAEGRAVGSSSIGQAWTDPGYFWGRPSATSAFPYDARASTGSNLGPSHPALVEAVRARIEALRAADPEQTSTPVPIDLVTTSGSGLDPNVSPAAALYQVPRIARVRGLDAARVRALVDANTEARAFGAIGEPRVNVLRLNLALDALPRG